MIVTLDLDIFDRPEFEALAERVPASYFSSIGVFIELLRVASHHKGGLIPPIVAKTLDLPIEELLDVGLLFDTGEGYAVLFGDKILTGQKPQAKSELTAKELVDLWNANAHQKLPRVSSLSEKRKVAAQKILAQFPKQETWLTVIRVINKIPSFRGESDRKWRASFDFILREGTVVKAIEGQYDFLMKSEGPWRK